jgi:hypothetical protein
VSTAEEIGNAAAMGPGGGRIEQFGVELERTEIKAYAGHATSLKSRQYSFS